MAKQMMYLFSTAFIPAVGPTWLNGYQGHFPRVKWSGNLADHHSPPSSAKIKNEWSYTFTFPTCLYCMHKDSWYIGRRSVKTHWYLTPLCLPEMGALRLVWPAAWLTSPWHVADNSLCRSRDCNDWAFYGIPPLPSNEFSHNTMKHWQTFFNITEPFRAVITVSIACLNMKKQICLSTQCIYRFHTITKTYSNYFPTHQLNVLCNGTRPYVLWRTKWIFKYYSHEIPSSVG